MIGEKKDKSGKLIKISFSRKQAFLLLSLIYFVSILSILRSNFNYIDDMGRIMSGEAGWETAFSRYGSTYLSYIVHADTFLTEISPLPQLLAVLAAAAAGLVILAVITGKKELSLIQVIAAVPVGISPYFLQCLSYKYDSPYMALSLLFALIPLLFAARGYAYIAISALCTVLMCITYQASSGIFPMLVVLMSFIAWNRGDELKRVLGFVLSSVAGYAAGLLFFRLVLVKDTAVNGSQYISGTIATPHQIIENYKTYLRLFFSDFKLWWIALVVVLCLCFVYVAISSSKRAGWKALIMSCLSLFLMGAFCLGVYPAITDPITEPRAMYGIGVMIACVAIYVVSAQREIVGKISICVLSWCFVVFALAYGNALYAQSQYTDFRIQFTIDDLEDIGYLSTENMKTVQIKGSIGHAPAIRYTPQRFGMLRRLVPITYAQSWYWGIMGIQYYYCLNYLVFDVGADFSDMDLPVLRDNLYETIYGDEEHIIIELK